MVNFSLMVAEKEIKVSGFQLRVSRNESSVWCVFSVFEKTFHTVMWDRMAPSSTWCVSVEKHT